MSGNRKAAGEAGPWGRGGEWQEVAGTRQVGLAGMWSICVLVQVQWEPLRAVSGSEDVREAAGSERRAGVSGCPVPSDPHAL